MTPRRALAGAAFLHVGASLPHGAVHGWIPVHVAPGLLAAVAVTVFLVPLAGLGLVATGRSRSGAWVLVVAGLAAFAVEGGAHFVVANPDHVASVADGSAAFAATAVLTTAGDLLLAGVAGWVLLSATVAAPDPGDPVPVE